MDIGLINGGRVYPQRPPVCLNSSIFLPYYVVQLSATVVAPLRTTDGSTFLQLKMVGAGTPGAICKIQSMENAQDILTFNMIPKISKSVQPFS